MDLTWSPAEQRFREQARTWLDRNLPRWLDQAGGAPASGDTRDGFAQHLVWERMLFEARWAVVSWPSAYGGRDASVWEWLIFEEEYYRAGAPQRVTQNGIFLLAPSLFEFGTPEQRRELLPTMASAQRLWCQGWSEPGAGSDLASLTSSAERVEGGWRLNGQKTWTTRGAFCTHMFGLFRSNPAARRHRGLSYLLVPLDLPGIEVRGFARLDGDEGFAEVFLDDVFLADEQVYGSPLLGGSEEGWSVAMSTTSSERGLTLRSPGRFGAAVERLVQLWQRVGGTENQRRRIAEVWVRAEAYRLQTLRSVTDSTEGRPAGAESSLVKVWWSELDVELHEIALDLLGTEAETVGGWSTGWMFALAGPIYAGTNEVQRTITAERLVGLPRS